VDCEKSFSAKTETTKFIIIKNAPDVNKMSDIKPENEKTQQDLHITYYNSCIDMPKAQKR